MHFRYLSSILFALSISSGPLLGAGTSWQAWVTCFATGNVIPISVPSNTLETGAGVSLGPNAVAITPDGTQAIVLNYYTSDLSVLDLTLTHVSAVTSRSVAAGPQNIAITPDGGEKFLVTSEAGVVTVLDLAHLTAAPSYEVTVGNMPYGIAITPDSSRALVANSADGTVSVLDVNPVVQVRYTVSVGTNPWGIAVTPDGTKALVTNRGDNTVTVLDLTQAIISSGYTVPVGQGPSGIAITPDGSKALITNVSNSTVTVLDLTTPTIGLGYTVPGVGIGPLFIAVTPDGTRAYVSNQMDNTVSVLDLTVTPITVIQTIPFPGVTPLGLAITPDQAPTSAFTVSVQGLTVLFNGSASFSPVGNIKEYIWEFGDGSSSVTTTGASVSHTYARSGEYAVSLTVVNDAGTSLDTTFTGQTVSNHGLPRARSTQALDLPPLAPHKFEGKVHQRRRDGQVFMKTTWHPSADKSTKKYKIYARHQKVKVIDDRKSDHATINLYPHHFSHHISKKYRQYLHDKYSIRSVNANGTASHHVPLHVKK
jgi:YVTN family beta-propeller protein